MAEHGKSLFDTLRLADEYRRRMSALVEVSHLIARADGGLDTIESQLREKLDAAMTKAEMVSPESPTTVFRRQLFLLGEIRKMADRTSFLEMVFMTDKA